MIFQPRADPPRTTLGRLRSRVGQRLTIPGPAGFRRLALTLTIAGLATVVGVGCDSGPTHPDESVIVTGALAPGQIDDYPLPLTFEGLVRFTVEDLEILVDGEPEERPFDLAVGFGLGRPTVADGCQGTSRLVLTEGQARTYRLLAEEYCIAIFDAGTLVEGETLSYAVQAETTD